MSVQNKFGFTLVEVLASVAILSGLLLTTTLLMNNMSKQEQNTMQTLNAEQLRVEIMVALRNKNACSQTFAGITLTAATSTCFTRATNTSSCPPVTNLKTNLFDFNTNTDVYKTILTNGGFYPPESTGTNNNRRLFKIANMYLKNADLVGTVTTQTGPVSAVFNVQLLKADRIKKTAYAYSNAGSTPDFIDIEVPVKLVIDNNVIQGCQDRDTMYQADSCYVSGGNYNWGTHVCTYNFCQTGSTATDPFDGSTFPCAVDTSIPYCSTATGGIIGYDMVNHQFVCSFL